MVVDDIERKNDPPRGESLYNHCRDCYLSICLCEFISQPQGHDYFTIYNEYYETLHLFDLPADRLAEPQCA